MYHHYQTWAFRSIVLRVSVICWLSLILLNVEVSAQSLRVTWGSYFDARLGLNSYGGERGAPGSNPIDSFAGGIGGGLGFDAGYIYSARWSAGLFMLMSRHPQILENEGNSKVYEQISVTGSRKWITVLGLVARYRLKPETRFSPYVQAGLGTSLTWINDHFLFGIGPRFGLGVDVNVLDNVDAFFEVDGVYIYPGKALDLAGPYYAADPIGLMSLGLRYVLPHRFKKESKPVRVQQIVGPERLTAGELGMYAVDIDLHDDVGPLDYLWDFGDGTTSSNMIAAHGYVQPGTYTVTFTASNSSSTVNRTMTTVVTGPVLLPEVVTLQVLPLRPKEGQAVQFSPVFRGTEPFSCNWDFGDGQTSRECFPSHLYAAQGMYNVMLEVTNEGGTDREIKELTVGKDVCRDVSNLSAVYFDRNSPELSIDSKETLRENISQLAGCPELDIRVSGYAVSGEQNGATLSQERAQAVAQYYINLGISSRRITTEGAGSVGQIPPGEAVWQYRRVLSTPVRRD